MLYYALRILAGLLCAMGCLWETVYGDLPSGASASYDRGTYLMKKHRYAEAVEALRVAAESGSPLEVAARLKRARAYWRSDHVTEAQSDLLIALNNVTEELRLRVNSAALYERRALVFVNQSDMLREVPLSQIGCLPDWQTPLQGALNDLNRALELEPLRPAALYMKTSVLTRMYRWKELIEFCKTTLDRAPGDARILIELAVAHLALEEWEPAITRCEEALAVAPDNTAAILLLAEVFERRGDWDGAKEVYTRALEKHPENAHVRLMVSTAHFRQEDVEAACRELERAVSLEPECLSNYGFLNTFREAIVPTNAAMALPTLNKLCEQAPEQPEVFALRGWAEMRMDDWESLRSDFRKSRSLYPSPECRDFLDFVKDADGNVDSGSGPGS